MQTGISYSVLTGEHSAELHHAFILHKLIIESDVPSVLVCFVFPSIRSDNGSIMQRSFFYRHCVVPTDGEVEPACAMRLLIGAKRCPAADSMLCGFTGAA